MSFWDHLLRGNESRGNNAASCSDPSKLAFLDVEVGLGDNKVHDIGVVTGDGAMSHSASKDNALGMLRDADFICGHNIIHHDLKYLFDNEGSCIVHHDYSDKTKEWIAVDTLYMSPLLFPERPYHRLLKDDKLQTDQLNNPVNDCMKARDLLMDEIAEWSRLTHEMRSFYRYLLQGNAEFDGFLKLVSGYCKEEDNAEIGSVQEAASLIARTFDGQICGHSDLEMMIERHPVALAYALALAGTSDYRSVTPPWVLYNYPEVEYLLHLLRHTRCAEGCAYCGKSLDLHYNLKLFFGFDQFRKYDGESLQENAARAAVEGKSLLAIFPTGGGKSLTFQLPALMAGRAVRGLTVVISPLQSLMKDQVDNLAARGITDAVTVNGLLDPIDRANAIERVRDGEASLLYISPEMLRSKTIEKILLSRDVVRFVIDEAHCFSAWGQDFRVDYMHIGKFIREYQKKKQCFEPIPVSCFTATAKQKVVQDICDYFRRELGTELYRFASSASRTNLHYSVLYAETDDNKYSLLRNLVSESDCPAIVYVSRTKRSEDIARKLTSDGYPALPFNGRMEVDDKVRNQEAFMNDEVRIIVATSAFGMGVDKKDVGLVIHYDISDSLENYVQEAGRAGRDPHLEARCYVLYNDADLDKHFILLNQTKLSISEIQQVWRAVKSLTRQRPHLCCSALEIARAAGWDDSVNDIETRVKTAVAALEQSGYLERGNNVPRVFATGITVRNMDEARARLEKSLLFDEKDREKAVRIIKSLISEKYKSRGNGSEAESRIDYLADILALTKREVISAVDRMRQEGILADSKDLTAFLNDGGSTGRKANTVLDRFARIERYIIEKIPEEGISVTAKLLNDDAVKDGIQATSEKDIRTILFFLSIKGYVKNTGGAGGGMMRLKLVNGMDTILSKHEKRTDISRFVIEYLYGQATGQQDQAVHFSVLELLNALNERQGLFGNAGNYRLEDVEEALLYLSKIGALKIEGGFLVIYNAMDIRRIKDAKFQYKKDDYKMLDEFYRQKIQQVHIVGEYANLMVKDYNAALAYVSDYFRMDYRKFIAKYFKGERVEEIERNLTPAKYNQLFRQLSPGQMEIINDKESRCIVVAAGPGSGKTRVLVHKLASILMLEDVKHEQLLMLTFSRTAATEFKERLAKLIGNAAMFVEIKTFHSYAFDILGRVGNLDDSNDVVSRATRMILDGEVEPSRISKSVLVIDEAQDMCREEFELVKALMDRNEELRLIAVGDDDQNIFEFRGSDSMYMRFLAEGPGGRFIEMTQNYRSSRDIVKFANAFAQRIGNRLKKTPIEAVSGDKGNVEVVLHTSDVLFEPLVNHLMRLIGEGGTSCVLTQTNEEAAMILAMLTERGVKARLVQSLDGFRFTKLAEVKYLYKELRKKMTLPGGKMLPVIQDEVWNAARDNLKRVYGRSSCLSYVLNFMSKFERTTKEKYWTDFLEFAYESSLEDFKDFSGADVIVSTIHKSKGYEFDNVYMLVKKGYQQDDAQMRKYYVGMTRAKKGLFIHTNSDIFSGLDGCRYFTDKSVYSMPEEIVLQLTHKDVFLDFFKTRKKEILSMRSGDSLAFFENRLYHIGEHDERGFCVAMLSVSMKEKLNLWREKGYEVVAASVRFVVAWKAKDAQPDEPESAIILPDLKLRRIEQQNST